MIYSQPPFQPMINPQPSFQLITPGNHHEYSIKFNQIINDPNFRNQYVSQEEYDQACDKVEQLIATHFCQNFFNIPNQNSSLKEPLSNSLVATPLIDEIHHSDNNPYHVDNSFQPVNLSYDHHFNTLNEPLSVESLAKRFSVEFTRIEHLFAVQESQRNEQHLINQKLIIQNQKIADQTKVIDSLKRKLEEMEKTNKPKKGKPQDSLKSFNSPINLKNIPTHENIGSPLSLNQLPNQKAGERKLNFVIETGQKTQHIKEVKKTSKEILDDNTHTKVTKKSPTKKRKTNQSNK